MQVGGFDGRAARAVIVAQRAGLQLPDILNGRGLGIPRRSVKSAPTEMCRLRREGKRCAGDAPFESCLGDLKGDLRTTGHVHSVLGLRRDESPIGDDPGTKQRGEKGNPDDCLKAVPEEGLATEQGNGCELGAEETCNSWYSTVNRLARPQQFIPSVHWNRRARHWSPCGWTTTCRTPTLRKRRGVLASSASAQPVGPSDDPGRSFRP